MLLAVFVAHDYRPWLSVAGTHARASVRAAGMDPRACDGWTTVRPLWLLGVFFFFAKLALIGALQAGAVERLYIELSRVDIVETAHVEHHHLPSAGPFAIGV